MSVGLPPPHMMWAACVATDVAGARPGCAATWAAVVCMYMYIVINLLIHVSSTATQSVHVGTASLSPLKMASHVIASHLKDAILR